MTQNNEYLDITQLEQINAVQSIRNAETLDDALRVMNGLAANGWLKLWDSATHPDGTSWRDKSPISQNEQVEAVAPELFWNKGDEYVMQGNEEVFNWATYNDYSHGESFDLEYSINGTATFMVYGDTVELVDFSPKYYTLPPKQIPDGWKPSEKEILKYASEEELFLFADESDLLEIANGILELVQIKINTAPTTSLTSETNTEVGNENILLSL